ncbi:uncharacterized protein LOC105423170 [Pogonomyrmex barbatus]|uniref:Uncharacterized protein LOC105423170 n=1 Tax=Pogonomyrmex barbatus TaxID=144034 RepID=A0A6I9VTF2_9HYME|nr:uncharacterized protein LOC105423170 [Pogonomyrmex barbatus]
MCKMFTFNGTYKWVDALPCLVSDYNVRKYSTIDLRPVDVTPAIAKRLLDTVYSAIKIAGPAKFKTTEVFKIIKMQRTNLVTYLLEDYHGKFTGAFYEHELHCATHLDVYLVETVLRRKGDKWLGIDGSHNSLCQVAKIRWIA